MDSALHLHLALYLVCMIDYLEPMTSGVGILSVSSEVKIAFLLRGKTPDFLNPKHILFGVIALSQAFRKTLQKFNVDMTFPGFFL